MATKQATGDPRDCQDAPSSFKLGVSEATEPKIETLQVQLAVLDLKPDDIVVVMSKRPLRADECARIKAVLNDECRVTNRVLVLEDGLQLGVLRNAKNLSGSPAPASDIAAE